MKKRTEKWSALVPVVLALGVYGVFFSRITCKPSQAGFWIIFVLGLTIGLAIYRFAQRSDTK
jgi:Mg2+ and Co2+ transporter CorA